MISTKIHSRKFCTNTLSPLFFFCFLLSTCLQGYSNSLLYDGEYIANTTSTVVVTVNYRLGALGFLVYGNDDSGPRGNYGLRVS